MGKFHTSNLLTAQTVWIRFYRGTLDIGCDSFLPAKTS